MERIVSDATFIIEGEPNRVESRLRAFASAAVTLTLGILGSSVLPVPFAFSRTGVLLGLCVSALVGFSNALTGTLLLRAAGHLEEHTFEALAGKAAGRTWKVVTEVSMVFLLFGTLCGDYALLADCGKRALEGLFPGRLPPWMVEGDGRFPMVALGLVIVFPLSCLKRIRSLEYAAMAGVGLVFVLAGVIVSAAVSAGFPAIASGELPLFEVKLNADLPEAVAVLSFAFYVQPMLLPLLAEMPAGRVGVNLTCKAVQLVTMVVAFIVYATVGVFAAARYGLATEGDILVNRWLEGRWDGALAGLVAVYLSLSMVPMVMTMRYQLDSLITGNYGTYLLRRELALTLFSLLTSLAVALKWPTAAEKMFAVTGASAVCLICYVVPVVIHLSLYFNGRQKRRRRGSFCFPHSSSTSASGLGTVEEGVATVAWPPAQGPPGQLTSMPAGPVAGEGEQGESGPMAAAPEAEGVSGLVQLKDVIAAAGPAADSPVPPGPATPAVGEEGGLAAAGGEGGPAEAARLAGEPRSSPALPVRGAPRAVVVNVSFDNWLAQSQSREMLGSSFEPLSYSPPASPSGRLQGRRGSLESQPSQQQAQQGGRYLRHLQHPQQQHQYQFSPPAAPSWAISEGLAGAGTPAAALTSGGASPRAGGGASPLAARLARRSPRIGAGASRDELTEPLLLPRGSSQFLGPGSSSGLLSSKGSDENAPQGYPCLSDLEGKSRLRQAAALVYYVALPMFVMLVGTAFSVGALWISISALFKPTSPSA